MSIPPLGDERIEAGSRFLKACADDGLPVQSAVWHYFPERGGWRLVIGSTLVDEAGLDETKIRLQPYLEAEALSEAVIIAALKDELIEGYFARQRFGPGVSYLRYTADLHSGVHVDDEAYIYRTW